MGRADLHIHSTVSDGMAAVAHILSYAAGETDLDVIAIADHDQVSGALAAVEWCAGQPGGRLQAVVGTEISASWGRHVLALFFGEPYPTQPFPRHRPLYTTLRMIQDAGGLAVLPHPLSALVPSAGARAVRRVLAARPRLGSLAGVEVCSGVVGGRASEAKLRRLNAEEWHLAAVGSSDAHHLRQVGSVYTSFPGRTTEDLRRAIVGRTTDAHWGPPVHVPLRSHARQCWRSLVVKPLRELRDALPLSRGEAVTYE